MADVVIDPKVPLEQLIQQVLNQFDTKADIDHWVRANRVKLGEAYGADVSSMGAIPKASTAILEKADKITEVARKLADNAINHPDQPSAQVDQSRYGKAEAKRAAEKAVKAATPAGTDQSNTAANTATVNQNIGGNGRQFLAPPNVANYLGGRAPTPEEYTKLIVAYNEQHPNNQIKTKEEFNHAASIGMMDDIRPVLEQALLPDPTSVWTYTIPERLGHGPTVEMSDAEHQAILTVQGGPKNAAGGRGGLFSEPELKKLVLVAAQANVWDANGRSGAPILAALAAASDNTQIEDRTMETRKVNRGRFGPDGEGDPKKLVLANQAFNAKGTTELTKLGLKFNEGMWMYGGSTGLAYLHALDPQLAARLASTPHQNWSDIDVTKANGHFVHGNLVGADTQLAAQGFATGDKLLVDVATKANGLKTSGGGSGSIRQQADPVQLRQAAKDLYVQMFFKDPSAGELDQFTAQVQAGIGAAPTSQSVSPEARIQQTLEGTQQYQDLYHSKPAGVSDADYRQQFQAAAQSQLGNVAPAGEAIRSGMRTGDYQTTVGAAANQAMVSGNNSTFLGRLAQTAALVNEMT